MESIETLNDRLTEFYGADSVTGRPIFRIVWANDQTEKRMVESSEKGVQFLFPEAQIVKKYPYLKDLYVLERLVIVPDFQRAELLDLKVSYEPVWAYCNADRNPVPPVWWATKFVVDTLYAALGKKSMAKYVEDEKNTTKEGREQRIQEIQAELFGNETETTDALAYKEGIVVPDSYKKEDK